MRRLFVDIETCKVVAACWKTGWKRFVDPDDIREERRIICVAWKWQDGELQSADWGRKQDDTKLLKTIYREITSADEVVAQNGERFDLPWIRTRATILDLQPIPLVKVVDTLQWARKYYYFESNSLHYLAHIMGYGGKIEEFHEGKGAWRKVQFDNDQKMLAKMVYYCRHDVQLLQWVWGELSVICPPKTHAGVLNGGEKWTCPRCASERVATWSRWATAAGTIKQRMRCKDCKGSYTISAATAKQYNERAA